MKTRFKSQTTTQLKLTDLSPMDEMLQDLSATELMAITAILEANAKSVMGESDIDPSLN